MAGFSDKLTGRQRRAVVALLSAPTIAAAAKAARVSERTIYRFLSMPAFVRALARARAEAYSQALGNLAAIAVHAASTLADAMRDPEVPWPSRIASARTVLEATRAGIELDELQRRIDEIEAVITKEQSGGECSCDRCVHG